LKKNAPSAVRRLLILLAALSSCIAIAGGVYAYRVHRLRNLLARWRSEGLAAAQNGQPALAVERLTSYLTYHPSDREALVAYAEARPRVESADGRHLVETIRALRYLLQLDPNQKDLRVKLLDLYVLLGRRTEAAETAAEVLKLDSANVHALAARVSALAELKKYDAALDAAQRWAAVEPTNLQAHLETVKLRALLGQPLADVLADLDAWGSRHPGEDNDARLELLRACALGVAGDRENCLAWLRKAARRSPPDDAFSDLLVAEFAAVGDRGEDVAVLKELIARGAGAKVRQRLMARSWEVGQLQQVVALSKTLDLHDSALPSNLLAALALSEANLGHGSDAASVEEIVRSRADATSKAWSAIIGQEVRAAGSPRVIVELCSRALEREPRAPYLGYFLGEALAAQGEHQSAIEAWQREVAVDPTWGLPLSRMGELLLDQGNVIRAAQVVAAAMQRSPTSFTGLVVVRVAIAQDRRGQEIDRIQLLALIDQLEKLAPSDGRIPLYRAQVLADAGRRDEATRALRSLLDRSPPPDVALLLAAAQESRRSRLGIEEPFVQRAQKASGGMTPALALDRALAAASSAGGDQAAAVAAGLAALDDARQHAMASDPQQQVGWAAVRARFLERAADPAAAAAAWRALGDAYPGNPAIQREVLRAGSIRSDRPLRERTIARLGEALGDGDSLACRLERARLLIETRSTDADDRAIAELLKGIISAHPSFTEARMLWASSLERLGKIDEAIDQVQLAVDANPDVAPLALRLAELYRRKGDVDRARQHASRVAESKASSAIEIRAAADLLSRSGETDKAVTALQRLAPDDEDSGNGSGSGGERDLALARLCFKRGDLDRAESLVDRVLHSGQYANRPDVLTLAAQVYAAQGKMTSATRMLEKLDALPLSAGRKALARAEVASAGGDIEGAVRLYRDATIEAPKDQVVWRALIAYLYAVGRPAEAAAAVEAALTQNGDSAELVEIKRSAATLAAAVALPEMRPIAAEFLRQPTDQSAAREILAAVALASAAAVPGDAVPQARSLSQRYPRVEAVQLWAIRTYLRAARLSDAAPALARAMSDFAESVDAAEMATTFHASQMRWTEMLDAAKQWRKRIPTTASSGGARHEASRDAERADAAIAEALVGLGRGDEALAHVEPLARAALSDPANHVEILWAYMISLQAAGQSARATDLLLPLATSSRSGPWRDACARFAAERLDVATATVWLGRMEETTPTGSGSASAEASSSSAAAVATLGGAWALLSLRAAGDMSARTHATALFQRVLQSPGAPAAVLERAGAFAEHSGEAAQATALYRRAIAADARSVIALNNLAMLLSARESRAADLGEAIRCAQAAVRARPQEPEFLDTLSIVMTRTGDYPAAIQAISRAVQIDPENVRWRVALAQLLFDSGQADKAAPVIVAIDTTAGADQQERLPERVREQLAHLRAQLMPAGASNAAPTTRSTTPTVPQ
jgi:tetratricopeptide (TPR) repeat protein